MNQNERIKNAQAQANRMRNRALKTTIIFLVVVVGGIALFVNFLGSGDSNVEREIDSLTVNENSASFTFNVGFMYTSAHIGLAKDVWVILKNNPEVNTINVKIIEVCEDQFGNKETKISNIVLDNQWINEHKVRSFIDEEKFAAYAWPNNPFVNLWTPRGNSCD